MEFINVFYQGEDLKEIQHIEVKVGTVYCELKEALIHKHCLSPGVILFIEDSDEIVNEAGKIVLDPLQNCIKLHLHRCRHIEVFVTFNGEIVAHQFASSSTIAKVKKWVTAKLGMSEIEANEHVLQISGTHIRPSAGTHLGALTSQPSCLIKFDLVPDQRINGFSEGGLL